MDIITNPFNILGATSRDERHRLMELADQVSTHHNPKAVGSARDLLLNPVTRLTCEMKWFPGVSPAKTKEVIKILVEKPLDIRHETIDLPPLARVNLSISAFKHLDLEMPEDNIAAWIVDIATRFDHITAQDMLRDINNDRAVSGFPKIKGTDRIQYELEDTKKYLEKTVKEILNLLPTVKLVSVFTKMITSATNSGATHAPSFIHDLVDSYEKESRNFLDNEATSIYALVCTAKNFIPDNGEALSLTIKNIEIMLRKWNMVAQPIQIANKARGHIHMSSKKLAMKVRGLSGSLWNINHDFESAKQIITMLNEIFTMVPEIKQKLEEDLAVLESFTSVI